jgi:hypothetical protein
MFAVLYSDINSRKSGLLHLTGQPYCKKCRSAKVKDGIMNLILRNYLIDRYSYSALFTFLIWLNASAVSLPQGGVIFPQLA